MVSIPGTYDVVGQWWCNSSTVTLGADVGNGNGVPFPVDGLRRGGTIQGTMGGIEIISFLTGTGTRLGTCFASPKTKMITVIYVSVVQLRDTAGVFGGRLRAK